MMVKSILFSVIFGSFMPLLKAQEVFQPDRIRRNFQAKATAEDLAIDGLLNEAAWQLADVARDFVQVEPRQGMPAAFGTEVRALYTRKHLYFGVTCYDSLGSKGIRARDLKRDFPIGQNDVVSIAIDAFNDQRNSMQFATNPYGAQYDYLSFDALLFDPDWNALWKVRTSRTDSSWVAEFQIPWKTLRYEQGDTVQSWGINFYRQRRMSNEISAWSPYPRSFSFNRMEYAGMLSGLAPPRPSANLQINPYMMTEYGRRKNEHTGGVSEVNTKFGGEVKWAISANSVLDATINTDFAQADADIAVSNLSRFSVLFPERRQFFLENASMFGTGLTVGSRGGSMNIIPFFSRTIGLDDNGRPLALDGGARYVHRSTTQNYGAMVVQQRETSGSPRAHFAVGRYARNLGGQDRVGGIVTMKTVAATDTTAAYTNRVGAVDGFFRLNNSNSVSAMMIYADNTLSGKKGYAGYAQYLYTTNVIQGWLTESFVTKDYINEVGFISRGDVISTSPGFVSNLRGDWLPLKRWVRALQPDLAAEFYHQASTGRLIESSIMIYPFWAALHSGGFVGISINPNYQRLTSPFVPLGVSIAPGEYRYTRYSFYAGSDPSKKIAYTCQYDEGDYFDGRLRSINASLAIIPIPHTSLKASMSRNNFYDVGVERQTTLASLYTVEGRLSLNPRVQLSGLYQHSTWSNTDAVNIRFSWEYRPLSYVFLVFNSRETGFESRLLEQRGIVKVSYLKQF